MRAYHVKVTCLLTTTVSGGHYFYSPVSSYRKPPTISPGLIYFRKRFLMGLYKGGGAYIRVGLYMDDLLC